MTVVDLERMADVNNRADHNVNSIMKRCAEMDELGQLYNKELLQQRERIQNIKKKLHAYNENIKEHEGVFNNFAKCTDGFINQIVNFIESWSYTRNLSFLSDCKRVLQVDDSTEINLTNDHRYNSTCYDNGSNKYSKKKSRRSSRRSRSREINFNKTYSYGQGYKSKSKKYKRSKMYNNYSTSSSNITSSDSISSSSSSSISNRYSINTKFNNYNIYNISNSSRKYQEEPRRSSYRENENIFDLKYPYDTIEIKELYEIYKQKKINLNFQNAAK